jgi:hypothetical protein
MIKAVKRRIQAKEGFGQLLVVRCGDVELEDHRTLGDYQVPIRSLCSLLSACTLSLRSLPSALHLYVYPPY